MAYFEVSNLKDSTTLFTGSISATGAGAAIDTTGYPTIAIQIALSSSVSINIEGSNDQTNWFQLTLTPANEVSIIDNISENGIFVLRSSAQYIRYNVLTFTGNTFTISFLGRSSTSGPSGADNLSLAMDAKNNSPVHVTFQPGNSGLKLDPLGAMVISDSPSLQPIQVNQPVSGAYTVIDTQGYQTIQITTSSTYASTTGVAASIDGITYTNNIVGATAAGVAATALVASTTYTFPCVARYLRIVATTAGYFAYTLRSGPQQTNQNLTAIGGAAVSAITAQLGMNMVNFGGTAVVTAGVAGMMAVGGNIAPGVAPTANPVLAGGIDTSGLTRRLLTDLAGRQIVQHYNLGLNPNIPTATTATSALAPTFGIGAILGTLQGTGALNVQDTQQFEGQTLVDLLGMILLELRIANQQRYETVNLLNNGINNGMDPPEQMRLDQSSFSGPYTAFTL
jgi:hypothetical protein